MWKGESLDHNEVIECGSYFLTNKPVMQRLLVSKYPIILIDESQDTHQALMDALFTVQSAHKEQVSGLAYLVTRCNASMVTESLL